jgi:hypothetical protein
MKLKLLIISTLLPVILFAQKNSGLTLSFLIEDEMKESDIIDFFNSIGLNTNLKKVTVDVYNYGNSENRNTVKYNGAICNIITKEMSEVCKSEILLKEVKNSMRTPIYIYKNFPSVKKYTGALEMPSITDLQKLIKDEKKLSKSTNRQLVFWAPKQETTINNLSVSENKVDPGSNVLVSFNVDGLESNVTWTSTTDNNFKLASKTPILGKSFEVFKPEISTSYCINYLNKGFCSEKICTDMIQVNKEKLEFLPIELKNKIGKDYYYHSIDDGRCEEGKAEIEIQIHGDQEYWFIVPKQKLKTNYSIEISPMCEQNFDIPILIPLKEDFGSFSDDNPSFTKLKLDKKTLNDKNLLEKNVQGEMGISTYKIESRIRIIPTKDDKQSFSTKPYKVTFQICSSGN